MEKSGEKSGTEPLAVRGISRGYRSPADQIIAGTRAYPGPAFAQREAGMKAGTYVVTCDACRGMGVIRIGQQPLEPCEKCAGEGVLTIHGEREDDSMLRAQPSWGEVAWFVIIGILIIAIGCEVIIWKAGTISK